MARFTFISSFLLPFVLLIAVSPFFVKAQTTCETTNPDEVCVTVGNTGGSVPGFITIGEDGNTPTTPQDYLSNLYNFLLGLVGVAAMGSIVYGGVLYIISAGNPSRVGSAKQAIGNGIIGIL